MIETPPVRGAFFEAEVEMPRQNQNLPATRIPIKFLRTSREWTNWATNIARTLGFRRLWTVRTITSADSPYTVQEADSVVLANATGGSITVVLPAADSMFEKRITVKKIDSSANSVTVDPAGAATIDGAATVSTTAQWEAWDFVTNNSNWFIV